MIHVYIYVYIQLIEYICLTVNYIYNTACIYVYIQYIYLLITYTVYCICMTCCYIEMPIILYTAFIVDLHRGRSVLRIEHLLGGNS